jgi:signal transduction histidine kinase
MRRFGPDRGVDPSRPSGVRVGLLFAAAATVVVLVAVAAGVLAAGRTAGVARAQARADALSVARRTAAVLDAFIERSAVVFSDVVTNGGLGEVSGPGAALQCRELLLPLTVQGFSFEVVEADLTPVCAVYTGLAEAAGGDAQPDVNAWLGERSDWDLLGPADEELVRGRMTLAPGGRLGMLAVAVPAPSGRMVVGWIETSTLSGPMGEALAAPGVATAVVVDDRGRILVPAPSVRDGQPSDGLARPVRPGVPVADPVGDNPLHARLSRLPAGIDAGVRPASGARGGPALGEGSARWVSAPVPRLDAHVVVAYDLSGAAAVQQAALRNALVVAMAVAVAALVCLALLWSSISWPLVRLAAAVRAAGRGRLRVTVAGPAEVRELAAALEADAARRDQVGEVAEAARERERERVVRVLTDEVAQSVAAASLLVRSDPEAAARPLRAGTTWLGRVTSELAPPPLPAGGVGPALVVAVGDRAEVEDRSADRRIDQVGERLLYRAALEVLEAVTAADPSEVHVAVHPAGEAGLEVRVQVRGGGSCPPLDDPDYFDRHELVVYGGRARVEVRDGSRRAVLSVP